MEEAPNRRGSKIEQLKRRLRRSASNRLGRRKPKKHLRRSVLRGKNWLKYQLDKRRYQIGFPIGWGSFSVVYFARSQKFLAAEIKSLQDRNGSFLLLDEELPEGSDTTTKELPEFVAVKVIKLENPLGENPRVEKPRQETMPQVRLLRTPQNDGEKMFHIGVPSPEDETFQQAKPKRVSVKRMSKKKLGFETPKKRQETVFQRLGKVFDMELNTFKERKAFQHFDPDVWEDGFAKKQEKEKEKKRVARRTIKRHFKKRLFGKGKSTETLGLSDSSEEEEEVEEVQEILEVGKNVFGNDGKDDTSWFKDQVPVFFKQDKDKKDSKVGAGPNMTNLRDSYSLLSGEQLTLKSDLKTLSTVDEEVDSEIESLVEFPSKQMSSEESDDDDEEESTPSVIHTGSKDSQSHIDFLSNVLREKRKKRTFFGESRSLDEISRLKDSANKLLTNQIRGQVQSVMTEIVIERASQMEHLSILDEAVNKNLMSEGDKKEYLAFKKEQEMEKAKKKDDRTESQRTAAKMNGHARKFQSLENISLEIKALNRMRDSKFAIYLFDVVQAPQEVWIVTEFAHIGCLATFCEDAYPKGVPEMVVKWLMTPIFLAIAHLHKCKMIHRDMKPSNVVLTHAGVPKLCDFGMIKEFTEEPVFKGQGFCGTEIYAPPESFGRDRYYSTSFDTWSLGMSMLALVYGKSNPWEFNNGNKVQRKAKNRGVLKQAMDNRKHKKCITYVADRLEDEVKWLKIRKELFSLSTEDDDANENSAGTKQEDLNVEYVGMYKRLSLLEKTDIENPMIEEVLLLMYYKDMEKMLTLKRKKHPSHKLDEQLNKLSRIEDMDLETLLTTNNTLVRGLKDKLAKGVPDFSRERKKLVAFIKKCLMIFEERPKVTELLKDDYIKKLVRSWEKFDTRIENKLLEIAVTGKFSCVDKEDFGGPYFNTRGEFMAAAKEVARKIHYRFTANSSST